MRSNSLELWGPASSATPKHQASTQVAVHREVQFRETVERYPGHFEYIDLDIYPGVCDLVSLFHAELFLLPSILTHFWVFDLIVGMLHVLLYGQRGHWSLMDLCVNGFPHLGTVTESRSPATYHRSIWQSS